MGAVRVLDCTLRDGGYCNQWSFGYENAKKVVAGLVEAGVDIIECGFFSTKGEYGKEVTKFNTLSEVTEILPANRVGKKFVVMANYGEISIDDVPDRSSETPDGIRVAYHKKDRKAALELCKSIKTKGYDVFIQAMVSVVYTDQEFLDMIKEINELKPYAFYIVDSFGLMKRRDMLRFFYLVDHNLNQDITLGFHSHNNMQLAFSNAQTLVDLSPSRGLILDSSIFGMGRGAGNLCTELLVDYLNDEVGSCYDLKPILSLMDGVIGQFYRQQPWGYSLPNYLSASHNAHPNYAGYFDDKKTLTVESMDELFTMMDESKRFSFDREYAEELYLRYMEAGEAHADNMADFQRRLSGKCVLLIAPGKSSIEERDAVRAAADEEGQVIVSVNFDSPVVQSDYIFVSNMRRFRELDEGVRSRCIATSNIPPDGVYLQVDYRSLLCEVQGIRDNAGLMAIRFLINNGVKAIRLAGFDGYSRVANENYCEGYMDHASKTAVLDATNRGVSEVLGRYAQETAISFVTSKRYLSIGTEA